MSEIPLVLGKRADLLNLTSRRVNETKLGETIRVLEDFGDLSREEEVLKTQLCDAKDEGVRTVLLGIEEDWGVLANYGRGGACQGFEAFLKSFLNMQDNSSLSGRKLLLLGSVDLLDIHLYIQQLLSTLDPADQAFMCSTCTAKTPQTLMEAQESLLTSVPFSSTTPVPTSRDELIELLRKIVAEVDKRVQSVVELVASVGLKIAVIGGGHNNSYPIISGCSTALEEPLIICNNDPHADTRRREGRHSGNGFSEALAQGVCSNYCLFGYHKRYNSAYIEDYLQDLQQKDNALKISYEEMLDGVTPEAALKQVIDYVQKVQKRSGLTSIGLEMCLDAIPLMPCSASTPSGLSLEACRMYVRRLTKSLGEVKYLHVAEGAPSLGADGMRTVGKAIAYLVADFCECTFEKESSSEDLQYKPNETSKYVHSRFQTQTEKNRYVGKGSQ